MGAPALQTNYRGVLLQFFDKFDLISARWQEFEKSADCWPFQTYAWASHYHNNIGYPRHEQPMIVLGTDHKGILFLMPLQIGTGTLRQLSWMGSDLCDYNAPLIAPDFEQRMADVSLVQIWKHLVNTAKASPQFRFDYVNLEKMPQNIGLQKNPMTALATSLSPSHAYRTAFHKPWPAFYEEKRSTRQKANDRYRRKKLGQVGNVEMRIPVAEQGILALLDILVAQKTDYFEKNGIHNLFNNVGHLAFFRAVATHARSLVMVSSLNIGEEVVGVSLGLNHRGTYYHVLTSYTSGELSKYSPGVIHLQELMKKVCEEEFLNFDFTVGDEPYKLEWSDVKAELYDYIDASTARGHAASVLISALGHAKRQIKQTPALWSAYVRLRHAVGSLSKAKA